MINPQMLEYIKQQIAAGVAREQIIQILLANGWNTADVNEAFVSLNATNQLKPIIAEPLPQKPIRKGGGKIFFSILITLIILLAIGGGVYAYFKYFNLTPEKVLEKWIANAQNVKTLEYSGNIKLVVTIPAETMIVRTKTQQSTTTREKQNINFSADFSGSMDIKDIKNPTTSVLFSAKTDALKAEMGSEAEDLTIGAEVRNIDKIIYLKINELPKILPFDMSVLKNQWIKISTEDAEKTFGATAVLQKPNQLTKNLTPEQIEEIKTASRESKIIKIVEKFPDEEIDGAKTYHYKFALDKEELKIFLIKVAGIIKAKSPTDEELSELNNGLDQVKLPEGELWIGKKDFLPRKITIEMTIEKPKMDNNEKSADDSESSGKMTLIMFFKKFNQPAEINIPTPIKTVEEIINEMDAAMRKYSEDRGDIVVPDHF